MCRWALRLRAPGLIVQSTTALSRNGGRIPFFLCTATEGWRGMRRIVVLLSSTVAGVLLVCGVGLLNAAKPAEATFPGKNGKIAYMDSDGHDREIYTISPGGERRFNVTNNNANDYEPSYSPTGKRIAYEGSDRKGSDVYTINAGGGAK